MYFQSCTADRQTPHVLDQPVIRGTRDRYRIQPAAGFGLGELPIEIIISTRPISDPEGRKE